MSAAPVFYTTPRTTGGSIAASLSAGKGLTAPTNIVEVAVGAANGSMIKQVVVQGNLDTTANTAGVLKFFLYDGTNYYPKAEILTTAATPSSTAMSYRGLVPDLNGLILPNATHKIFCGNANAAANNTYNVSVDLLDA